MVPSKQKIIIVTEVLIYYASYNQERHGSCLQTINGYSNIVQGMIYHINMFFCQRITIYRLQEHCHLNSFQEY
jgi:hypothetical protein